MRTNKNSRGFTVIELLVTIAVIGLLASIVLVALDLPGKRRQATLAKALEFSQSTQNAIGDEMVGSWTFENVTGNKTPDMSGNGNEGTISGAIPADGLRLASGVGTGKALQFDGVDDYVGLTNSLTDSSELTISAFVYYKGGANVGTIFMDATTAGGADLVFDMNASGIGIRADKNGAALQYENGAAVTGLDLGNAWHHVVFVLKSADNKVYVDGILKATKTETSSNVGAHAVNPSIGRWRDEGSVKKYFNGLIDEVRIYSRALTIGEIQKHYAAGAREHENLATITNNQDTSIQTNYNNQ